MKAEYQESILEQFRFYKSLGEKAIGQLSPGQIFWQYNSESNSIAVIIRHLSGNMLSRWTDFLHSDGEKAWRDRDSEFAEVQESQEVIMHIWEKGWACVLDAILALNEADLGKSIYIRGEEHSVVQAINRQLAHYSYHVGQIVYIARMLVDGKWKSLSIPKGMSAVYNSNKFSDSKDNK